MTVWSHHQHIYCKNTPWLCDDSDKDSVDSSCQCYSVPLSDSSISDDSSLSNNSSLSTISLDSLDDDSLSDDCLSVDSLDLDDNESDDSDSVPLLIPQVIQSNGTAWSKRAKMETTSCFQDLMDLEFLHNATSKYKNGPWDHVRLDWNAHVTKLSYDGLFADEYLVSPHSRQNYSHFGSNTTTQRVQQSIH